MKNPITKLLTAVTLMGAPAGALASPRVLASGAPACGNTMGKGGYTDDCTAEERAQWRAERTRQQELARQHERARRAVAKARERTEATTKAVAASADTVVELALLTVEPVRRPHS